MNEKKYPSIIALKDIYTKFKISILVSTTDLLCDRTNYPALELSIGKNKFSLFIDDEYEDLAINNPILTFCLLLRELEDYDYALDYLEWCKHHDFDVSNSQVREYYLSLGSIYRDIENILGEINSQVSDYDFELNAGAAQFLRKDKTML
jgi:hypothetical protein